MMSMLPLQRPIRNGQLPDWTDLNRTRDVFRGLGLYDDDQDGPMLDKPLVKAIENFQRSRDLIVDGIMNPGGETEQELIKETGGRPRPTQVKTASTDSKIGFGGSERGVSSSKDPHHPDFGLIQKPKKETVVPKPKKKPDYKSERNRFDLTEGFEKDKKEQMDEIENFYKRYVEYGKNNGFESASRYLDHYLKGTGEKIALDRHEIKEKKFLKKGADKNTERFKDSFLNKDHDFNKKIKNLKEGETVNLKDHWDYKFSPISPADAIKHFDLNKSHILSGRLDEALATGNSHIKSSGDIVATKTDGKIIIEGIINHNWNDVYDFTPLGSFGAGATVLEKHGRAKKYPIQGQWTQKLKATIIDKNGKLLIEKHDVKDID